MHSEEDDIWYRIGYAVERLRRAPDSLPALETLLASGGASGGPRSSRRAGRGGAGRPRAPGRDNPGRGDAGSDAASALVRTLAGGGASSLAGRLFRLWPPRKRVGVVGWAAAGASGAAAALLLELVAPLARPGSRATFGGEELAASMLEGVGRGLTYGVVVEPRLPGPAFLLGFVYGTAEYLAASWGGLPSLLRSVSPLGKISLFSGLLEPSGDDDRAYLEFVLFGLALALLYDAIHENRGIEADE